MNTRFFDSLAALFWVFAFFFALPVIEPYEISRFAAVLCAVSGTILLYGRHLTTGIAVPRGPIVPLIFIFWLLAAASLIWSVSIFASIIALATFSLMQLGLLSTFAARDSKDFLRIVTYGGGVIFLGLALWPFLQHLWLTDYLVGGHVRHPFANPNSYAAVLSLGFFGGAGIMLQADRRLPRYAAAILVTLILGALLLLSGRGALLALAAGLLVLIFFARAQIKTNLPLIAGIIGAAILLLIAALILAPADQSDGAYIMTKMQQGQSITAESRLPVWFSALQIIRDHIWLGSGFGSFFLMYGEYRLPSDRGSSGLMAHNDLLQFWAELGFVAPLIFAALLLAFAVRFIRTFKAQNALAVSLFCGLLAMTLHSFVSFNFYVPAALILAGIYSSYWLSATSNTAFMLRWPQQWYPLTLWICLLIPAAASLTFLHGLLYSEYFISRAQNHIKAGRFESYAADINRADNAGFGLNPRPYVQAANLHLSLMESGQQGAGLDEIKTRLARAKALNPRLSDIYYNEARLYALQSEDEKAEKALYKALALNPLHVNARLRLARHYYQKGAFMHAHDIVREGLRWPIRRAREKTELNAFRILVEKQMPGRASSEDKNKIP